VISRFVVEFFKKISAASSYGIINMQKLRLALCMSDKKEELIEDT
jgi:hypothetical protein